MNINSEIKEEDYTKLDYIITGESYNGLTKVIKDKKVGYFNNLGEAVIPCLYNELSTRFSEGYACVKDKNGWKIINPSGKTVKNLAHKYHIVYEFHNGLALVEILINGLTKFNYIDINGQELLKDPVIYASNFSDNLALIKDGILYNIIDSTGKKHPKLLKEYYKFKENNSTLELSYNGFSNGLLKVYSTYNPEEAVGYIYKDGKFLIANDDLNNLYQYKNPQFFIADHLNPDLLKSYYCDITVRDKTTTLKAASKEELNVLKREFYEKLKRNIIKYTIDDIDSRIAELTR